MRPIHKTLAPRVIDTLYTKRNNTLPGIVMDAKKKLG